MIEFGVIAKAMRFVDHFAVELERLEAERRSEQRKARDGEVTVMRRANIVLWIVLTLLPAGVAAHHGWSGYDSDKVLDLTGVIRESGYEHPHGYLKLEVPGKTWLVVLAPPSRMERRGLPPTMLKVGTTVKVVGYPHRTEADELRAERITVNGKTVELR